MEARVAARLAREASVSIKELSRSLLGPPPGTRKKVAGTRKQMVEPELQKRFIPWPLDLYLVLSSPHSS